MSNQRASDAESLRSIVQAKAYDEHDSQTHGTCCGSLTDRQPFSEVMESNSYSYHHSEAKRVLKRNWCSIARISRNLGTPGQERRQIYQPEEPAG